jgi:hypothetical protein
MKRMILATLAVGLGASAFADKAAKADKTDKDAVKGSTVTISGCVLMDKDSSFVLTQVEEVSGPTTSAPNATLGAMSGLKGGAPGVIYWLSEDSVKMMREHLNHKVEVTGVITDVSSGTIRVKQEPGKDGPDNTVKVEARNKEATVKTDMPVSTGPEATVKKDETQTMPVRRVKVDTVKMISATCR